MIVTQESSVPGFCLKWISRVFPIAKFLFALTLSMLSKCSAFFDTYIAEGTSEARSYFVPKRPREQMLIW